METPTGDMNLSSGKFSVNDQYTADMNIDVTCKLSISGGGAILGVSMVRSTIYDSQKGAT
jgi:hypothetical protein